MGKNLSHGLAFICEVVIISLIIIIPILIGTTKDKKLKRQYDERQELIRGRGFKYAFYTMITLNMLYAVALGGFGKLPLDADIAMFAIVLIGAVVYAWYGILSGGYFALNEKVPQTIAIFIGIAIFNICIAVGVIKEDGSLIVDGVLSSGVTNLACAVLLLATVVVILVKRYMDREDA